MDQEFDIQNRPLDVLLIRPKSDSLYQSIGPDLGLGYLATALRRSGKHVSILDIQLLEARRKRDDFRVLDDIERARPRIVGFKMFSIDVPYLQWMLPEIRKWLPDSRILIGGPHPSGDPELAMQMVPDADYGFVGEAEQGLPQLAEAISSGEETEEVLSMIPGLIRRRNGKVKTNHPTFSADLDSLGMPAWDLMKPSDYPVDYTGSVFMPIITTRGCPFPCQYCAAHRTTGRTLRYRSPHLIAQEIEHLKEHYGIKRFHVDDDNFTLNGAFAKSVLHEFIRADIGLPWRAPNGLRLDTLDEELVHLLEKAGCFYIYVGIESGSQETLDRMSRGVTLEQMEEKINLIRRHSRIKILGFFMIGYDGESRMDVEKTIDFARRLPLDMASFFFFTPLPGTPVYYRLKSENRIDPMDPAQFLYTKISISSNELSEAWLHWAKFKANLLFYLRPFILWGMIREIRSWYQVYRLLQRIAAVVFNR